MKEIALIIGTQNITAPGGLPQGGFPILTSVLRNGITIFILIALSLAAVFIVWSGIQWITSGGDKQKLAAARARLTWTIVGLLVVLFAFAIVAFIGFIFQVDLLNPSALR